MDLQQLMSQGGKLEQFLYRFTAAQSIRAGNLCNGGQGDTSLVCRLTKVPFGTVCGRRSVDH